MTGFSRRQFTRFALATSGSLALASCSKVDVEKLVDGTRDRDRLRVDWSLFNPVGLAYRDQHLFEEDPATRDYEIDWIQTGNEWQSNDAVASKALLVGTSSGSAIVRSRALGMPIKAIAVASEPNWNAIFSSRKANLKVPADLKGMRVAVQGGVESFYYLLRVLQEAKMTLKDITPVFLDPIAGFGSMEADTVDAWCGAVPHTQLALYYKRNVIHRNPTWGTHCYLTTHDDNVTEFPELLQAYVNNYQAARSWVFFNQAQLAQRLESLTGLPAEPALRSITDGNPFVPCVPTGMHQLRLVDAANIFEYAGEINASGRILALRAPFETKFAKAAPTLDFDKLRTELVG